MYALESGHQGESPFSRE